MRTLLLCTALAFLGLGITERVQAQRGVIHGGFSSGHGWSGGLGYYGGNYYRGFGYGNSALHPYTVYGSNSYIYPSSGYSYSNTYVYPPYYGNAPRYSYYYSPSYPDSGVVSPVNYQQGLPSNRSVISVLVPDPEAVVLFNGQKTGTMGRERLFSSPVLEAGYNYSYQVTASWTKDGRPVTESRSVQVVPGQPCVVDFTRAAPAERLATPAKTK